MSLTCRERKKNNNEGEMRANEANKHIDWLIFFIETVIVPGLDRLK